jgi:hypothetical protein
MMVAFVSTESLGPISRPAVGTCDSFVSERLIARGLSVELDAINKGLTTGIPG